MAHVFPYHRQITPEIVQAAIAWATRSNPMVRRAAKVDVNQSDIVKALRAVGATVQVLSDVGKGYQDDCEKYSWAAANGWTVLRFTTGQIKSGQAIEMVRMALE